MKGLYSRWGWEFDGTPFAGRLEAEQAAAMAYKSAHKYENPTLEELGLSDSGICDRFGGYIKAMGLEEAPKGQRPV